MREPVYTMISEFTQTKNGVPLINCGLVCLLCILSLPNPFSWTTFLNGALGKGFTLSTYYLAHGRLLVRGMDVRNSASQQSK